MTKKEIKVIMKAIDGCQGVIGTLAGDEHGLMTDCADKELHDTYFCLNRCWLYLHSIIEKRVELEELKALNKLEELKALNKEVQE